MRSRKALGRKVEIVGGSKVVGATEKSLVGLKYSDGRELRFGFSVDEFLNPNIAIRDGSEERILAWSPETKMHYQKITNGRIKLPLEVNLGRWPQSRG